jgi:prephenate dehydrogenase
MEARVHDKLTARTSHFPHLLAAALVLQVLDRKSDPRQWQLCATGFRDTTRVAGGSSEMWGDIVMANRSNLVAELSRFEKRLAALRRMLNGGQRQRLERFLGEAQRLRLDWKPGSESQVE